MRGPARALGIVAAGVVFVLLLAIVAVQSAPATLAAWLVARQSGGTILLADAEGLLRSGRARVTDAGGRWSAPVTWTLDTGALWQGVLALHLGATPADPIRGALRISRTAIEATGVSVTLPAAIVRAWLPPILAIDVGGDLAITTASLRVDAMPAGRVPAGRASARWSPARIADAAGNVIDFGSASADIDAANGQLAARLANSGGDTALEGEVRVDAGRIDADVTLTPRSATPSPLLRNIVAFGAAAPGGGTRFGYHGAWRGAQR